MQFDGCLGRAERPPTEIPTDTDRSSWCRARRRFLADRHRRTLVHTTAGRCRSGSGRNRHRCASRAQRWHWPAYCGPPPNESRDDRAWNFARADILRCREGSPERSTERTPCTGIDPGTRRTSTLNCASITGDATTEGGQRKMLHQLRKHQFASVHIDSQNTERCPASRIGPATIFPPGSITTESVDPLAWWTLLVGPRHRVPWPNAKCRPRRSDSTQPGRVTSPHALAPVADHHAEAARTGDSRFPV